MTERLVLSDPVRRALSAGHAVVALETSVLAQGLPPPRNLEAARSMEAAVRSCGAEPAWIWIGGGSVRIGTRDDQIERLASGSAVKVARRDLPMALAWGGLGATTVSATLWAAHRAGIEVMATGGVGGVHPGSGDVSADLWEMATSPGLIVCSGPKSIVDPRATLERLEELGVGVIGYRCERLPFFLVRQTDIALEHRADEPAEIARIVNARRALGVDAALLLCNPIPAQHAMKAEEIVKAIDECQRRAVQEGVTGKDLTPFLLSCLAERTAGASVEANLGLLEANAALAAQVAAAL